MSSRITVELLRRSTVATQTIRTWSLLERQGFTVDGLLFYRHKSCSGQLFGRNVNQFSIKSLVCQMYDKYTVWQCLHSARISVIYFF